MKTLFFEIYLTENNGKITHTVDRYTDTVHKIPEDKFIFYPGQQCAMIACIESTDLEELAVRIARAAFIKKTTAYHKHDEKTPQQVLQLYF